ncbi:Sel1 repeat-containing protein [Lampropedia hyalina DSM 16112]|jgi:TPR repeat protein|uniref:Sel1 repeat-containing protein n=1 Tax=Lampropedia hyalina DSM 16112 TaxID=1122156 RepID=A0A1M5D0H3_9BURK|nr:SEL1-like repeat protein [Lampropedia hyalina]SHF60390.1 Sel1 repeat-containing protein [Lampropedia hyalina DSM 16112]
MMTETVTISLDAVIAMSGRSRRTWWRRIEEGSISKLPADARGRTLLVFGEIRPALGMALTDEEVAMIARADAGDALAQAEAGAMFALRAQKMPGAGSHCAAFYWLEQAAAQGSADAMHWLGMLYAAGRGESGDSQHLALMWIAQAAAQGHAIARQQVHSLTGRVVQQAV